MRDFLSDFLVGEGAMSETFIQPIINFAARFYVAYVFFKSGLTKVDDKFMVTQSTKDLFAYEFNVPLLPPDIAAYLASYAELILPILLVLGLFTRLSALALFILNAVAMWSLAQTDFASAVGHWQHILWGVILAFIFAYGPSRISIDSWMSEKWRENDSNLLLKLIAIAACSAIAWFLLDKYL